MQFEANFVEDSTATGGAKKKKKKKKTVVRAADEDDEERLVDGANQDVEDFPKQQEDV